MYIYRHQSSESEGGKGEEKGTWTEGIDRKKRHVAGEEMVRRVGTKGERRTVQKK